MNSALKFELVCLVHRETENSVFAFKCVQCLESFCALSFQHAIFCSDSYCECAHYVAFANVLDTWICIADVKHEPAIKMCLPYVPYMYIYMPPNPSNELRLPMNGRNTFNFHSLKMRSNIKSSDCIICQFSKDRHKFSKIRFRFKLSMLHSFIYCSAELNSLFTC